MTSSLFTDDLLGLKNKLDEIEKQFEEKTKEADVKREQFKKLDDQIADLVNTKDAVVKLNVGGKIFQTKVATLLSVKDTLFFKYILQKSEEDKDNVPKEIFFDRSYRLFPLILDYLRTKKFSLKSLNRYDIDDLELEAEYYGLGEILEELAESRKEVEFVSFNSSGQYSNAGTHKLEDLKDKSMTKGICVQSPYYITIEFNFEHEIDSIEVSGMNGNSSVFYVGNGANAKILTSVDNKTWKEVGQLPANHGATIQTVKLTPSYAKYIKFQHNSYLGIGYLHVNRRK